jgi:hypothetical protein
VYYKFNQREGQKTLVSRSFTPEKCDGEGDDQTADRMMLPPPIAAFKLNLRERMGDKKFRDDGTYQLYSRSFHGPCGCASHITQVFTNLRCGAHLTHFPSVGFCHCSGVITVLWLSHTTQQSGCAEVGQPKKVFLNRTGEHKYALLSGLFELDDALDYIYRILLNHGTGSRPNTLSSLLRSHLASRIVDFTWFYLPFFFRIYFLPTNSLGRQRDGVDSFVGDI